MTRTEFEKIGEKMFGGTRWGSKMAEATGLSTAMVSNIRRGIVPISRKSEAKIAAAYDRFNRANGEFVDGDGTGLEGDASFGIQLQVKDLITGKFIGIHNIDPVKFFEMYAPKAAQKAQEAQVQTLVVNTTKTVVAHESGIVAPVDADLTDEEILTNINTAVSVVDDVVQGVIAGVIPSMIVYGPAGIGKSHSIMTALDAEKEANPDFYVDVIKGSVRAPGLVRALFKARHGGVVVLDDSDSIFRDEEALNILKAALESTDERTISWRKESPWLSTLAQEEGVDVAAIRNFEFNGSVIFITNVNLKAEANKDNKMAEHFNALLSRSLFHDLKMDSIRARVLRVQDVFVNKGMAASLGISHEDAVEISDFIAEHQDVLSDISLRMAKMIANVFHAKANWKTIILHTKTK